MAVDTFACVCIQHHWQDCYMCMHHTIPLSQETGTPTGSGVTTGTTGYLGGGVTSNGLAGVATNGLTGVATWLVEREAAAVSPAKRAGRGLDTGIHVMQTEIWLHMLQLRVGKHIYKKTIASILTYFALCFVLLTYFFFSRSGNLLFGITLWSIFRLSGCTWLIVAPLIFVGCWLWPSNTNTGHVFSKTWVARPMWTICQSVLCETQQAFQLPSLCLVSESLEYIQKTCIYMCMSNCETCIWNLSHKLPLWEHPTHEHPHLQEASDENKAKISQDMALILRLYVN